MKTKFLPILTTAFVLLCTACSDDSTSNAITGNDDDHGSVIAGKETVNTFETPGTGKEYDWGGEISESITSDFLVGTEYEIDGWGGVSNKRKSGLLTAGEWNDLDNWASWIEKLDSNSYKTMPDYWKFFPNKLVAVKVVDGSESGIANVRVELLKGDKVEFSTKTDNSGFAYCWASLFSNDAQATGEEGFSLKVDGKVSEEDIKVTGKEFAKNGIKIIPVAASGVDKDTEFMLRFFEVATGGTYVFITNDSGIGNDHIDATWPLAAGLDSELVHAVVHHTRGDPEITTSGGNISVVAFYCLGNYFALVVFHKNFERRILFAKARHVAGTQARLERGRQVVAVHAIVRRGKYSTFHAVFEFTHVARPVVAHQQVNRGRRKTHDFLAVAQVHLLDKVFREQDDIGLALC